MYGQDTYGIIYYSGDGVDANLLRAINEFRRQDQLIRSNNFEDESTNA